MFMPKVSIIMPNYNAGNYLLESIESILNQTFSDFEFIIIDDCSTDRSWEIIQEYSKKDTRIIALKNEENLKICKTLNKWLEIARGEYIARMDSDDVAFPDRLEKVYNMISSDENLWVCWSNFFVIDGNWNKIWEKKFPHTDDQCRKSIWFRNPFAHNTVIFRKKCYDDFWGYNDDFVYAEDFELWLRFGQKYKFYNVQLPLVQYRVFWGNSILQKQKQMIRATLKARRSAFSFWYKFWFMAIIFYFWTWFMLLFPSRFVLWLFNKLNS